MIYFNPSPILFHLGPLDIRWYGLIFTAGFLFVYYFSHYLLKKQSITIETKKYDQLLIGGLIVVLIGARLSYIICNDPASFIAHPLEMLKIWHGGLSIHGGVILGSLYGWWWTRKESLDCWKIADAIMVPLALALAFGRLANFINQEVYGPFWTGPWAIVHQQVDGLPRHPTALYAASKNLLLFITLLWQYGRLKAGQIFWLFIALYSALRFIVDFWRVGPDLHGLLPAQWVSIPFTLLGIIMLIIFNRKRS